MRARAAIAIVTLLLPVAASADPIIGERAPPLADVDVSGGVIVVDFFATWCEPCHEAMAALDDIVKKRKVRLVVVDVGESEPRVRAWFAEHPLPEGARLVVDWNSEAAHRWGQHRFPTTFVLAGGVIRHINRGFGSGYAHRLDQWVAKESGGGSAP